MSIFSRLYHQLSKDHAAGQDTPRPSSSAEWPDAWKDIYYKTYPRFRSIPLSTEDREANLFHVLATRESRRTFEARPLSRADISMLLKAACGIGHERPGHIPARSYPSGGGRYPIEVYPILIRPGELLSGLYHYGVRDNALNVLWERPISSSDIATLFTYEWARGAAGIFVLTASFDRTQIKYAERGYRYILLEAGHVAQNICLVAEALGIAACPVTGLYDDALEKFIDIDGTTESVVYAVALGYPHAANGEI